MSAPTANQFVQWCRLLFIWCPALKFLTLIGPKKVCSKSPNPPDWDAEDFEIPPYLRAPENGTRLATENMVASIDNKIEKLAALGLRPHPNLLSYRQELMEQLDGNGPYRVRSSSGFF